MLLGRISGHISTVRNGGICVHLWSVWHLRRFRVRGRFLPEYFLSDYLDMHTNSTNGKYNKPAAIIFGLKHFFFQILMVFDVYRVFSTSLNAYDACIYVIILIFILGPIIVRGLCVVCIYYKDGVSKIEVYCIQGEFKIYFCRMLEERVILEMIYERCRRITYLRIRRIKLIQILG